MWCCYLLMLLLVFKVVLIGYEDNKRLLILKIELLCDDLFEVLIYILSNFFLLVVLMNNVFLKFGLIVYLLYFLL